MEKTIDVIWLIVCLLCGVSGQSHIAVNKPTKSSSALGSNSSNAVDGNLSPSWQSGSCFHVDTCDLYPWWQVDLQAKYQISRVKVVTRLDCCKSRFHDVSVEIFMEDPTLVPSTESRLCSYYNGPPTVGGDIVTLDCSPGPVVGRFVRLSGKDKRRTDDILQFCEVQVFGILGETNRALNKPTKSSSTMGSAPERAVDGDSNSDWGSHSCFQTSTCDKFPWWQVDLQDVLCISKVEVVTRSDCCPDRFRDVTIQVYDVDPTTTPSSTPRICTKYEGIHPGPGETVILPCTQPVSGRFVRIAARERTVTNDLLQLCEVRVIATNSCSLL